MSEDKGISHEEIINLAPVSEAFCAAKEVRIGTKTIQFRNTYRHQIRFERGVAHNGRSDFKVETIHPNVKRETCSLGHVHEKELPTDAYVSMQISWEMAEKLIDWFQSGDYKTVRAQAKKEKELFKEFKENN